MLRKIDPQSSKTLTTSQGRKASMNMPSQLRKYIGDVGSFEVREPSLFRRYVLDVLDATPTSGHYQMGLLELDVTDSRKAVKKQNADGKHMSLLAFIIKSIATAMDEDKRLNAMRKGSKIVQFEDVDIAVAIEMEFAGEQVPRPIVIRNAAKKTVEQIHAEIAAAQQLNKTTGGIIEPADQNVLKILEWLTLLPKFIRTFILRALIRDPFFVKRVAGTTSITAVGMFGKIPGFIIHYYPGKYALSFSLGSVIRKPAIVGKEIVEREFMSITVVSDHDLVDGAPAARFANRIKKLIETGEILMEKKQPEESGHVEEATAS